MDDCVVLFGPLFLSGTEGPVIGCTLRALGPDVDQLGWDDLELKLVQGMHAYRTTLPQASPFYGVIYRNCLVRFYREVLGEPGAIISEYHPTLLWGPRAMHVDIDRELIELWFKEARGVAVREQW
ncbi:hypothetical protein ASPACDRAFT_40706 [Aspergillus aculeatus ATCC 16872]|uniref:Uncharacterized protein n=1 Tax=Aspergillus aculeatus (strain ATCC 16872 / CBS 172.66 / WB 5094) TaxID=690307 RepID=A0A1L9X052_ASPA1|nr:uncharacterized protein ASPACDRAFT_40706 [Aspergillus aculeatus ATCC 16872]OJK01892.1 hypothetical protein ASPACDRAFT_40706 [Aspergillus aculeatus ATCC 16872]